MDKKLHIVQHLYGESDPATDPRLWQEDEALRDEYQALSEVKFLLDHRRPARPDPDVVTRIVAAAGAPGRPAMPGLRRDRAARPPRSVRRTKWLGVATAVFAVVLAVGVSWRQFLLPPTETARAPVADATPLAKNEAPLDAAEEREEEALPSFVAGREEGLGADEDRTAAPAPAETPAFAELPALADVRSRVDDGSASRRQEVQNAGTPLPEPAVSALEAIALADESAADSLPAWDEGSELLRLHDRLELIEARSRATIWDESTVMSLDALPSGSSAPAGVNAAGDKRPNNRP